MKAPRALASNLVGAMNEPVHKQAEIGVKSTQEQMVVGLKLPQEQAPPEKTPAPKPRTTHGRKKEGDAERGPAKPRSTSATRAVPKWRRENSEGRENPITSPSPKARGLEVNPKALHLGRVRRLRQLRLALARSARLETRLMKLTRYPL